MRPNDAAAKPEGGLALEYCGAIDFGGTKTLVGVVNRNGTIIGRKRFETDKTGKPDAHFERCSVLLKELLAELGVSGLSLAGIGVTVPGLAEAGKGILLHAPFLGWKDVPVIELLRKHWPSLPIAIANDVNACALAEAMFGAAHDMRNLLWVTVSTGIGGGLIVDGHICEGENGLAGEIGHVVVEWQDGAPCGCGNRGCLEAHASGTAITAAGRKAYVAAESHSPLRVRFAAAGEITAQSLAEAAQDGLDEACGIFRQAGEYLGRALSAAVNVLNPGGIVIGGGVSQSYSLMADAVREVIQRSVIGESNRNVPIAATALGYEAGLIGAASLIWSRPQFKSINN